jgi:hypothetical protein
MYLSSKWRLMITRSSPQAGRLAMDSSVVMSIEQKPSIVSRGWPNIDFHLADHLENRIAKPTKTKGQQHHLFYPSSTFGDRKAAPTGTFPGRHTTLAIAEATCTPHICGVS